jgi:DNA-binding MarR family transcriptional regulator
VNRDTPVDFQLGEFLPYLVNRVGVRMVRVFQPALDRFGVSLGMWRVLAALWQSEGTRLVDLALRTSIEVSTLSRTVGALRRRGLVRSMRKGTDAREISIALTAKGRVLTGQIIPMALDYEARMAKAISLREGTELRKLLNHLYRNLEDLEAAAPIPSPRVGSTAGD